MMLAGFDLDATQLGGMAAFGLAALACAAASRGGGQTRASLWITLAALQLGCAAEVALGWRYQLHAAADALLESHGWYASRTGAQIGLIAIVLLLTTLGIVVAARRWRDRGPAVAFALAGSSIALALFIVETISLHDIDAFVYAPFGPIKMIGLLWAGPAALVTLSALSAARH